MRLHSAIYPLFSGVPEGRALASNTQPAPGPAGTPLKMCGHHRGRFADARSTRYNHRVPRLDTSPRPSHIPALDGLRGCAILLVLLVHVNSGSFGGRFSGEGLCHILSPVFGAGWVGVDLFFVLSGFLITRILLQARGRPGYFFNFYRNRILRIFPLFYGTIFITLIIFAPLDWVQPQLRHGLLQIDTGDRASLLLFYYNFRESIFTHRPAARLTMFWTLCVEEHFYLLWPLAVWKWNVKQLRWICLGLIVISTGCRATVIFAGWNYGIAYLATPCRIDGLAIGGWIALAFTNEVPPRHFTRWAILFFVLSAAGLAAIICRTHHFYEFVDQRTGDFPGIADSRLVLVPGIFAVDLFFGSVLMLVLKSSCSGSPFSRIMSWTPLRSIGKYSFGIYAFHSMLLAMSALYLEQHTQQPPTKNLSHLNPLYGKPLMVIWTLLISYCAGFMSFHFWEKPFQAFRRKSS